MRRFITDSPSTHLNGTTHYQYDAVGHLLSALQNGQEQAGYESDAVDNLVEIRQGNKVLSLIPNGLNQVDRIESQHFDYDANGNLLNDGQRSYQWDSADRLIQVTDLQTGQSSEFTYDGYSRRITETEKDANGNITKQLKNIWRGESLCAQQDENGQTINRFFTQGEVQNGKNYLYAQDQVGSVYALVDDQGKVAGRTAYDSYGNITYQTGTQPIMAYAGLYLHKESGLHLATYRAYNPATARWLNRDPIREAGGLNIYAYVNGDPVNYIDPNGKYGFAGAVYGAIAGGIGGHISGGWQGAVAGATTGALVGSMNPFGAHAVGAGAGAGVASLLGQGIGNAFSGKDAKDPCNYDLSAMVGAILGGALGGPLGSAISRYVGPYRLPIVGRPLNSRGISKIPGNTIGSVVEGISVGAGELAGQQF